MAQPPISRRHVAAAVVGNWLEFYDFTVYAYFAIPIGDAFFPGHSPFVTLMASLITYGVGFVCRPLGAMVIGWYGDHAGRRPAMLLSFALMGLALVAFALIPPWSQIGVAAPALVVACRIVQGFALGGEVGPTTAYLIEAAPEGRRGFYGAWQSASQSLASLSGGVIGVILANVLPAPTFHALGWRIAFLIGALVLPFGFAMRRSLPETRYHPEPLLDVHPETPADAGPMRILLGQWRTIVLGVGLITGATVATYVIIFMPTYAQATLHMGPKVAFWLPVVSGVAGLFASLAAGWLADRIGRRPLMIGSRLFFLIAAVPSFLLITRMRSAAVVLSLTAVLNIALNFGSVPSLVAVTEAMRKEVRAVAMATVYATAVSIFGGTTQAVVHWLDTATGSPVAIAWYATAATLIALAASVLMPETAWPRRDDVRPVKPETSRQACGPTAVTCGD